MTSRPVEPSATARWAQVCAILDALLDAPIEQRARILAEHCGEDSTLRAEVQSLLDAEALADARLESPIPFWAESLLEDEYPQLQPGQTAGALVGAWRLIEELGRGGMGTVWLAERTGGDFQQRAALKLLKRGIDSDAILERFAAERRILARLAHHNIAHFIDGGVTDDGLPYFAMELVSGEPITRWCDANRQSVPERLRLFLSVVDAVQHAHRQLVVHRDLKPSNILVTASGEAKLLDFGIAKLLAAEEDRAELATLTRLGFRLLTPEYAAPEQLRGEAVTTATDVYALGVLLYELLSGHRPTTDAASRLPPRPSTRVSEDAASHAGMANTERLRRVLRGDLDTIVLRALHPQPERRYGSAEALGADLRRYLDGRPVLARPDSAWYRARKFVARNRIATAAAALIVLSLTAGLLATMWQAREARLRAQEAERQTRRAEQVKFFLTRIFEAGSPQEWRGKEPTARDLLDAGATRVDEELSSEPELHAEMLSIIGALYVDQGQLDHAETLLRRALEERRRLHGEDNADYADALAKWSALLYAKGDWPGASQTAAHALAIFRRKLGDHPRTAQALDALATARLATGDAEGAIALRREALAINRRTRGNASAEVASDLRGLGELLLERERYAEAEPVFAEALEINRRLYGDQSVRYANVLFTQARLAYLQGMTERAADVYRRTADIYRRAGDAEHLQRALHDHGIALCRLGHFEKAENDLRESVNLVKQSQAATSQWIGVRLFGLGGCLIEAGRPIEAEPYLREGLVLLERDLGVDHNWTVFALRALARSLVEQGRAKEAVPLAERALRAFELRFGPSSAKAAESLRVLATARFTAGARAEGLDTASRALRILSGSSRPDRPYLAMASLSLGELDFHAGKASDAESRLRSAIPLFDAIGDRPRALTARMLLGASLTRSGRLRESETLLREVTAARRGMYGDANPKTSEADIYLAACLIRQGKRSEGKTLLENARARFARQLGPHHDVIRYADEILSSLT